MIHRVYVRKRPGVDHFMRVVAEKFEVVIFTASLSKVRTSTHTHGFGTGSLDARALLRRLWRRRQAVLCSTETKIAGRLIRACLWRPRFFFSLCLCCCYCFSLQYADPLLDILDRNRVVKARLFREACVQRTSLTRATSSGRSSSSSGPGPASFPPRGHTGDCGGRPANPALSRKGSTCVARSHARSPDC